MAFSPDGKTLASGSADNNVVIWDVPTGEDLMTLKHNGTVEALRFSPDGRLLASASHEPSRGSVCLWRAPADEEAPENTLRSVDGPTVSDRPASLDAATAMRPTYPDPALDSPGAACARRSSGGESGSADAFRLCAAGRRPLRHGALARGAAVNLPAAGQSRQYRSCGPLANRRGAVVR